MPGKLPRIIHQIWISVDDRPIPDRFAAAARSWRERNPDWSYVLWTGPMLDELVRERYPKVWSLFSTYPEWIQRVDAGRYMILHHHGGVYSDMDVICERSVDDLTRNSMVLPVTAPFGLSNDLIFAEPRHEFLTELIARLPVAYRRWGHWYIPRHFRILLSTGSLYVSFVYRGYRNKSSIALLPPELYGAGQNVERYVTHIEGDSWAGWDTRVFVFIHKHARWIASLIVVLTMIVLSWAL